MRERLGAITLSSSLAFFACASPTVPPPSGGRESAPCPVTRPDPDAAAPPIVGNGPPGTLYGNSALWVGLPPDGEALLLRQPDGSFRRKFMWWRLKVGQLTIQAVRLDVATAAVRGETADGYGDSGFQPSGIAFTEEGCWQVTGRLGDDTLTFVILVRERN